MISKEHWTRMRLPPRVASDHGTLIFIPTTWSAFFTKAMYNFLYVAFFTANFDSVDKL